MSHSDIKSNDPVQLKQTILYLSAELNKYKNKNLQPSSSLLDELQTENERLTTKYKELLHQNKKYEKRLQLYEKRIRSLEAQQKESLTALERLQDTEKDLRSANKQLSEALASTGKDQHFETMETFERLEMKVNTLLQQSAPPKNELSLPESNPSKLKLELDASRDVNDTQYELITLLEEYINQLTEEAQTYNALTNYLIQKINAPSSE